MVCVLDFGVIALRQLQTVDSTGLLRIIPEWFMPNLEEVVFQAPVSQEVSFEVTILE